MNAELVKLRNTLHKDFYTNQYYLIRVFFYDSTTFCLNENNNFSRTLSLYISPPPLIGPCLISPDFRCNRDTQLLYNFLPRGTIPQIRPYRRVGFE